MRNNFLRSFGEQLSDTFKNEDVTLNFDLYFLNDSDKENPYDNFFKGLFSNKDGIGLEKLLEDAGLQDYEKLIKMKYELKGKRNGIREEFFELDRGKKEVYRRKFLLFDAKYDSSTSEVVIKNLNFGLRVSKYKLFELANENDSFSFFLVVVSAQSKNGKKRVEFCDLISGIEEMQLPDEDLFIDKDYQKNSTGKKSSFYEDSESSDYSEIETLMAMIANLNKACSDLQDENEALKNKNEVLDDKVKPFNSKLNEFKNAKGQVANGDDKLKKENDFLKNKNEELDKLNKILNKRIDLLNIDFDKKKDEHKALENKYNELNTNNEEMIHSSIKKVNEITQMEVKISNLEFIKNLFFFLAIPSLILLSLILVIKYFNNQEKNSEVDENTLVAVASNYNE